MKKIGILMALIVFVLSLVLSSCFPFAPGGPGPGHVPGPGHLPMPPHP